MRELVLRVAINDAVTARDAKARARSLITAINPTALDYDLEFGADGERNLFTLGSWAIEDTADAVATEPAPTR